MPHKWVDFGNRINQSLNLLRRLSKNSPSKFISPCHQMTCGFRN